MSTQGICEENASMGTSRFNILWADTESQLQNDFLNSLRDEFICWLPHENESFYNNLMQDQFGILLLSEATIRSNLPFWNKLFSQKKLINFLQIILIGDISDRDESLIPEEFIFCSFPQDVKISLLKRAIENATLLLENKHHIQNLHNRLHTRTNELKELNKIGIALSSERDTDKLLDLILQKSREITGADAATLYLVEEKEDSEPSEHDNFANKQLRFKLSQCDSIELRFKEFAMPIARKSIAGYVTLTGKSLNIPDAYDLSSDCEFTLNRSFDESVGYRTKSVLVIPMKTHKDEIIGVLQLINRKKDWHTKLSNPEIINRDVIPFDKYCEDLANSLASQAAVSIENNRLYQAIKNLFDGFVLASVHAIEQRDPTTSGHSVRVAQMSLELAKQINSIDTGPYKHIHFSQNALQQILYAALLHDFGKIGVRENVLVKAKKLYPHELDIIVNRFKFIKCALELKCLKKKFTDLLLQTRIGAANHFQPLDDEYQKSLRELENYLDIIIQANEPTVLEKDNLEKLTQISQTRFQENSTSIDYITPYEKELLSIPKGSLSAQERKEIESHVSDTFNFLSKIPWTSELKSVPDVAHAHHEKLDGSGYPRRLKATDIPIEAKIMAIADVYDALTASDRPYKKAVPVEKALAILEHEKNAGKIDPELFRLFIEAEVYKVVNCPDDIYEMQSKILALQN